MTEKEIQDKKIQQVSIHFKEIMKLLGVPHTPSTKDTPNRVAKMYVTEIFAGLSTKPPKITTFPNEGYDQMVLVKDILVYSVCEHHFVPIIGKCHIAYLPGDKVIGLSKLSRVAQYYSARPQLQERLCQDIQQILVQELHTDNVAVIMELKHLCCSMRGAKDPNSTTITSKLGGSFRDGALRTELFQLIKQ